MFEKTKNYIKPIKKKNTLAMHQRIIVIGGWIAISFTVISVILELFLSDMHIIRLLQQFMVGITCSMIVVIITTVLQFIKTRAEIFKRFYYNVFGIIVWFGDMVLLKDETNSEDLISKCKEIKMRIDECNRDTFDLIWFSAEKEKAYNKVVNNLFDIKLIVEKIIKHKMECNEIDESEEIYDSTFDKMSFLWKKEFPDIIDVFEVIKNADREKADS